MLKLFKFIIAALLLVSCTVSYKFNGASVDYTKMKTISLTDFPIRAQLVYAPLGVNFNEALKDIYTRPTKLNFVNVIGDIPLEGETIGRASLRDSVFRSV